MIKKYFIPNDYQNCLGFFIFLFKKICLHVMKTLKDFINEKLNVDDDNIQTEININKVEKFNFSGISFHGKNYPWLKSKNNGEPTGVISCTLSKMTEIMGFEPENDKDNDKTLFRWCAEASNILFTVYDWKVDEDLDYYELYDVNWHIGTKSEEDLKEIQNILEEKKENKKRK